MKHNFKVVCARNPDRRTTKKLILKWSKIFYCTELEITQL